MAAAGILPSLGVDPLVRRRTEESLLARLAAPAGQGNGHQGKRVVSAVVDAAAASVIPAPAGTTPYHSGNASDVWNPVARPRSSTSTSTEPRSWPLGDFL